MIITERDFPPINSPIWEYACPSCELRAYTRFKDDKPVLDARLGCLACGQTLVPESVKSREAREAEYEAGYREWWARLAENEELNKADGGTRR